VTRRLVPAALLLLAFAAPAHAAVSVSVTPSHTVTEPRDANTYTITYAADTDTTLTPYFQLPSHGQPCSKPEEQGEPYGNDPDSMFLVTTPGLLVAGRIVTWPDSYTVTPAEPLTVSLDVLMPPLGGCFYAGASATPSRGVTGLARGARVFNDQSAEFGTGGTATSTSDDDPLVTVSWWMRNGTNQDVTVAYERLGATLGFAYQDSTLGGPRRLDQGYRWLWSVPLVIPAHSRIYQTVHLTRPCGAGQVSLRLRIQRSDGLMAGTGDGVHLKLAECPT
jgi:hypothetical protein